MSFSHWGGSSSRYSFPSAMDFASSAYCWALSPPTSKVFTSDVPSQDP